MPTIRARDMRPALAPGVLALFVHGWGGEWPALPDGVDVWAVFDLADADLRRLYQTHRADVEAEARRRGLSRSWAAGQFGEGGP
jgi:hypothetical protein